MMTAMLLKPGQNLLAEQIVVCGQKKLPGDFRKMVDGAALIHPARC